MKGALDERATEFAADVIGLLDTLADDVSFYIPGPKDLIPFVGLRQGRDQVAQFFAKMSEFQDGEQFELRDFIAQGDKAVALGRLPMAHKADTAVVFERVCTRIHNSQ